MLHLGPPSMLPVLAALFACSACQAPRGGDPSGVPHEEELAGETRIDLAEMSAARRSVEQVLFHAVLEGLYTEGVSSDVVDAILVTDGTMGWQRHFIAGCPICSPCLDAFRLYAARPAFSSSKIHRDTFGPGLAQPLRSALLGEDDVARQEALSTLIARWLERRIELEQLEGAALANLREDLKRGSEQGEALLASYMQQPNLAAVYAHLSSCPWCAGGSNSTGILATSRFSGMLGPRSADEE